MTPPTDVPRAPTQGDTTGWHTRCRPMSLRGADCRMARAGALAGAGGCHCSARACHTSPLRSEHATRRGRHGRGCRLVGGCSLSASAAMKTRVTRRCETGCRGTGMLACVYRTPLRYAWLAECSRFVLHRFLACWHAQHIASRCPKRGPGDVRDVVYMCILLARSGWLPSRPLQLRLAHCLHPAIGC